MAPLFDSAALPALLDKLIVAGLIYACTLILEREAALRFLVILIFLIAAEFISDTLGLTATASFFHLLLTSAPIILAIIFQSDIKRALFSFG